MLKLAEYFQVDEALLLRTWLSDKIYYEIEMEYDAIKVLKAAEEKVRYKLFQRPTEEWSLKR